MSEAEESAKVTTEGSAAVLNRVKGRLEKVEAGDLPTIQRVSADGTVRRVDHTGEMIRPEVDPQADAAARAAAEAFAAEHRAGTTGPKPPPPAAKMPPIPQSASTLDRDERPGLWARIVGWFRRS